MQVTISDAIKYIGVDDRDIDLFESQYVVPDGVTYNSYLILDEKTALMDTVDARGMEEWERNLQAALDGRKLDFLVISHLEPDHAGSIGRLLELYPDVVIVGNAKTFNMLPQFFDVALDDRSIEVREGDTLSLGWACEARRYYFNIVGRYGASVQALLKKASKLDISMICPLHGPILKEDLGYYIGLYDTWSSYKPENTGVLIAYASIHGNTAKAAQKLGEMLREKGVEKVVVSDLAREDMAEVIEDAFRYDRMILAAASYDGGVFPCMQDFLHHLQSKAYQKRTVGILENGSWGPTAGRTMKAILETMKNISVVEPLVTIKSTLKEENMADLEALADAIVDAGV